MLLTRAVCAEKKKGETWTDSAAPARPHRSSWLAHPKPSEAEAEENKQDDNGQTTDE